MEKLKNDVKSYFERKSIPKNSSSKKGTSDISGIVSQRMRFFEDMQGTSGESVGTDSTDGVKIKKKVNIKLSKDEPDRSNIEKSPALVINKDRACIYNTNVAVNGSYQKSSRQKLSPRPRFVIPEKCEDKEVRMRLKVIENEHDRVHRYKSILKAPLTQQLIVSKYKSSLVPSNQKSARNVASIIDKWNEQSLSTKEQENLIDIDLLNSIRKTSLVEMKSNRPIDMSQLLEDNRTLRWVNTERVRSSDLRKNMTREEIFFQECQFELISSEASYYQSLSVLVDKFYNSPSLSLDNATNKGRNSCLIKAYQKEHLFSNILHIHSVSGKFLAELEKRFEESIILKDVCDIVTKYAKDQFNVYVPYLQNQKFQTEAYIELKQNATVAKVFEELEGQPECYGLSLDSFLMLPMQRLFRILLLLKAIKKNAPKGNTWTEDSAEIAIKTVENVIEHCSAKKGKMDERQRMLELACSLTAKSGDQIPVISSGTLLHEGELKCQRKSVASKNYLAIGRMSSFLAWIILTNEYLLITKINRSKKLCYVVEDMCVVADVVVDSPSAGSTGDCSLELCLTFHNTCTYVLQAKSGEDLSIWTKVLSICPRKR